MRRFPGIAAVVAIAALAQAGSARDTEPQASARAFADVLACRGMDDAAQRLACFDRSVGVLDGAAKRRDVVVVDRAQMQRTRRSLFGLTMPSFKIFGSDDKDDTPEIAATLRSARVDGEGHLLIVLDDGAVWRQTDEDMVGRMPKSGDKIMIRRGALGSYFIRLPGQSGFKARRES